MKVINNFLDKLIRPEIRVLNRFWPAFQVCGCVGLVLSILLAVMLVWHLGLSYLIMGGLVISLILTFLVLAMATKIIAGEERLIYYHHQIAVIVLTAVLLWLLRQPVLPYLAVTILGVGMFLACGRIGCLMVGCCHGRPHHWGVRYREEHAAAGFTPYYVGSRLFPIQALESLWVFAVVVVGAFFILGGYTPGTALVWYVITYGVGRFFFEFMRGDPERSYFLGFSEAQWISLFLMCLVVWAELAGVLRFNPWHTAATAGLMIMMIAVALRRRFRGTQYRLLKPNHVREVADALDLVNILAIKNTAVSVLNSTPREIHIAGTSLGIQISASRIKNETNCIYHYAISSQNGIMSEKTARIFAGLITQFKHPSGSNEFIKGNLGVFHLLVHPEGEYGLDMPHSNSIVS